MIRKPMTTSSLAVSTRSIRVTDTSCKSCSISKNSQLYTMTVPPDIHAQAYKLFTQEVPDLLQMIEANLLTLMQDRRPAEIHNLMRTAHSIKGGAAGLGLEAIATLAHRLENIFKAFYNDTLTIDTELESQLLQAYDCLRLPLIQQITTGQFDAEQALVSAEPVFARIEERLGDILKDIEHYDIPNSAQLGVDMTLSILEIDVSEQLERLTTVIGNSDVHLVEQELRSQAEIFVELAEILNKPKLGVIAEVVLDAVKARPDQVLRIAQLALDNFQAYRQTLLGSNGKNEIGPSAALLAVAEDHAGASSLDSCLDPVVDEHYSNTIEIISAGSDKLELPENEANTISINTAENSEFTSISLASTVEVISEATSEDSSNTNIIFDAEAIRLDSFSQIAQTLKDIQQHNLNAAVSNEQNLPGLVVRSTETSSSILPFQSTSEPSAQFLPSTELLKQFSARTQHEDVPIVPSVTVRVDSDQLEQMNNLVNEAVIKRSSLSLQNDYMQKSIRGLLGRFATVEQIVAQLRKVSDQTLIPGLKQGDRSASETVETISQETSTNQIDFDALEMDSYGTLHSLLQRFLEDMIQLRESVDDISLFARRSDKNLAELRKALTHLQDDFMWVRMLPIGEVLNHFPRMLRDLSISNQKPAKLKLTGAEVLVDKAVIERIYDPLLHLLRNAFDHGIEFPNVRRQRGKPEQGLIEINVFHRGGQTIIEVIDDGQGLNLDRIGSRAIEMGILTPQQLATISDEDLADIIFEPGFSTAQQVSELSGRGVGLDVVRTQLSQLKGTISVTSQPGTGTTFTLRLPLTLTSDNLLVCLTGFTTLALPSGSIKEILIPKPAQIVKAGEQWFLQWREEVTPIYRLSDLLEYAGPVPDVPSVEALSTTSSLSDLNSSPSHLTRPLLVIEWKQKFAALEVDQLITEQNLVIKPFGTIIAPPTCIYGCTILGDGSVVPVIDGAALLDQTLERTVAPAKFPALPPSQANGNARNHNHAISGANSTNGATTRVKSTIPKVLVVEDAVSLRQTLVMTLERAGYRVLQAGDGWEALRQLQFNLDIDLVISDIEMPNMNGFDFMNYRRQDSALTNIPLVILTSRSSDKHRRLAIHLGATAYFTKPYIEQEFLRAIREIIEGNPIENAAYLS